MADIFRNQSQFPMNYVGPAGQHAFMGVSTIWTKGTTGLVGTAFGMPGVGASRISTGSYNIFFPKAPENKSVKIFPHLEAPSGTHFNVNVSDVHAGSGTAKMQITRNYGGASASVASLTPFPYNPPTGTKVHLQFVVNPITPY